MSLESDVAIMASIDVDRLVPVLQEWAQQRERAADFGRVTEGGMSKYAAVIVGQVNYLDVDELKALIRNAREDKIWRRWESVGLMVHVRDAESHPVFALLGEDGVWSP